MVQNQKRALGALTGNGSFSTDQTEADGQGDAVSGNMSAGSSASGGAGQATSSATSISAADTQGVDLANLGIATKALSELDALNNSSVVGQMRKLDLINSILAGFGRLSALDEISKQALSITDALEKSYGHDTFSNLSDKLSVAPMSAYTDHHLHAAASLRAVLPAPKDDPEAFYYSKWPPHEPIKSGSLTCELFRHQGEEEVFEVEVLFPNDGDVKGAVLCRIEAENLTKPVECRVPVQRSIEQFELVSLASKLVELIPQP